VLAAEKYGLKLLNENTPIHDAEEIASGRMVQIKSSFKGYCYFPFGEDRVPDYFLSIVIEEDGKIVELFNGPGQVIVDSYIKKSKLVPYKNSYYTLAKGILKKLNKEVEDAKKIKVISTQTVNERNIFNMNSIKNAK
jgi:hypothetical protein